VSLKTEAYFRSVAGEALARIDASQPPVPFDVLADSLGIPIRPVNLPTFFGGALVYEDGMPVMIVNWRRAETQQREATAHMIAHVLLVLEGDDQGYSREEGPHPEAEILARELLLPTPMVTAQARLWFNDHRYLARLFGVEERRMVERMRELDLLKGPPGVLWEY
jgi:Zn-dependent peptidase ImmA (M78 family)